MGRLAPLGLHDTRFRSVPVSCGPRAGADASSPRHETRRNVANSRSLKSRKGLRRQTSSVLYAPSALPAMALPYESPTVPVGGGMPNSPTPVAYTRDAPRALAGTAHETVRAAMRGGPMIPPVPAPAAAAPRCPWRWRTPGPRSCGRTRRRRTPCGRTSRWPCARRRRRPRAAGSATPPRTRVPRGRARRPCPSPVWRRRASRRGARRGLPIPA